MAKPGLQGRGLAANTSPLAPAPCSTGDGKMEDCLQDHRHKEEFSERCRRTLEARMARQSSDYELNYGLR